MRPEPITVIGLGPMGRAMAGALLRAGHPVTVFNRTGGRGDDLVRAGARRAATAADAVTASPVTILSLTDYPAMYDILRDVPAAAFAGRDLGEDPGLAQLLYQAQLDVFLTALSGLLHATALVTASGVPAADFLPEAMRTLTDIPGMVGGGAELARVVTAGEHPGELSTTLMMGATAAHVLRASAEAGVDRELPAAVRSHYDRAIEAGYGTSGWTALYEVIRAGPASVVVSSAGR
ncbi:NAD(P)-binding domain-containing protein [Actinoplanes sp. DH11]|uniref:imine reductase family protein n=1 Tax=Actinoplanes sp. DH11 TaxID=2857011 RepID=UPI001E56685C|nr:NAD(P)-binding domain-containing protein [Actinoplanes sp. DH11]